MSVVLCCMLILARGYCEWSTHKRRARRPRLRQIIRVIFCELYDVRWLSLACRWYRGRPHIMSSLGADFFFLFHDNFGERESTLTVFFIFTSIDGTFVPVVGFCRVSQILYCCF